MAEVATELEAPFGRDENDVDLEKMLRRIDKHTASQLSLRIGRPVANFDLFPMTRKTDGKNKEMKVSRHNSQMNLYADSEKSQGPVRRWFSKTLQGPVRRWFSKTFGGAVVVHGNGNEFFVEQETRIIEEKEHESLMRLQEEMSKATRSTWKAAVQVARGHSEAGLELPSQPSSGSQIAAVATQARLRSLREESVTLQRKATLSSLVASVTSSGAEKNTLSSLVASVTSSGAEKNGSSSGFVPGNSG